MEENTKMKRKKIQIIFGTRPEAIKMAPVIKELEKNKDFFVTQVIVTAQHREMLDQVMDVFNIKADYDMNIMKKGQTLSEITSNVLIGLEKIFIKEKPDMVLVHGDTTTSFSAALAAYYQQIPIGHVEAGLRTYDKYTPFPEEANRQLIDGLSDLYFVPTTATKENLINEYKDVEKIYVTGNTSIDSIKYTQQLDVKNSILDKMTNDKKWILLTMHRRENQGSPMDNVFLAVRELVEECSDIAVIMPVHLSPKVQGAAQKYLSNHDRIILTNPLEVDVFHKIIGKVKVVLTDSGGLQEEAPALDIPVLVLREKTERPEGLEAGTLKVVGTNKNSVKSSLKNLLENKYEYEKMSNALNPYGDGTASKMIVSILKEIFFNK